MYEVLLRIQQRRVVAVMNRHNRQWCWAFKHACPERHFTHRGERMRSPASSLSVLCLCESINRVMMLCLFCINCWNILTAKKKERLHFDEKSRSHSRAGRSWLYSQRSRWIPYGMDSKSHVKEYNKWCVQVLYSRHVVQSILNHSPALFCVYIFCRLVHNHTVCKNESSFSSNIKRTKKAIYFSWKPCYMSIIFYLVSLLSVQV